MRTLFRFFPLVLCLLVACQKDSLVKPSATLLNKATDGPDVLEAKEWFEHSGASDNSLVVAPSLGRFAPSHSAKTAVVARIVGYEHGYATAIVDWKKASGFAYANRQSALRVPVHFQGIVKRLAARPKGTPKAQPAYMVPDPELFISKDPTGKYQLEVREFEPDPTYMSTHRGHILMVDYSGYIKFYDWQGHLVRGYLYRAGVATAQLSSVANATTSNPVLKSAHKTLDATVCITMVTDTYEEECYEDNCGCFAERGEMRLTFALEDPIYPDEGGAGFSTANCYWQGIGSESYQQCNTFSDPTGPGPDPSTGSADTSGNSTGNSAVLTSLIDSDPLAAFPPCPGLTDAWIPLIAFKASAPVINRLQSLTHDQMDIAKVTYPYNSTDLLWQIQSIQNAQGLAVNLDRFSVTIPQLPTVNGIQLTAPEFLEYIRNNINDFVPPGQPTFTPQTLLPGEATKWQNHELGSIVSINIFPDAGSVILSDYGSDPYGTNTSWKFSTIHDGFNGSHPVSGTREFGISTSYGYHHPPGLFGEPAYDTPTTYTFYIQGADRIDMRLGEIAGELANGSLDPSKAFQFQAGDALWNGMMGKFASFVNDPIHGGQPGMATFNTAITNRPRWKDVINAIKNGTPLQTSVPCN